MAFGRAGVGAVVPNRGLANHALALFQGAHICGKGVEYSGHDLFTLQQGVCVCVCVCAHPLTLEFANKNSAKSYCTCSCRSPNPPNSYVLFILHIASTLDVFVLFSCFEIFGRNVLAVEVLLIFFRCFNEIDLVNLQTPTKVKKLTFGPASPLTIFFCHRCVYTHVHSWYRPIFSTKVQSEFNNKYYSKFLLILFTSFYYFNTTLQNFQFTYYY